PRPEKDYPRSVTRAGLRALFCGVGRQRRIAEAAAAADAADEGKLEARRAHTEGQAEQVDLEPFDAARRRAEKPAQRELHAAAARRAREELAAQVVLADRGAGKIDFQLRHRTRDPGGERIGVRAGPQAVFARVGIGVRSFVDAPDELVN